MPVILLERIPLPSLRTYTSVSVLLLSLALFYAYQCVLTFQSPGQSDLSDENGIPNIHSVSVAETVNNRAGETLLDPDVVKEPVPDEFDLHLPYESFWWNVFYVMTSEIWCVWVSL